jgi:hypothetical protein
MLLGWNSDLSAYSFQNYNSFEGYAGDIAEIARELNIRNGVSIDQFVSALC